MTRCETCASRDGCGIEPIPYHCDYYQPDDRKKTEKTEEDR